MTIDELLSLDNSAITKKFLNKQVKFRLNNNKIVEKIITGFEYAGNPNGSGNPHLICGFIFSDKTTKSFQSIDSIDLL